jgi:virginiamycin B lyase
VARHNRVFGVFHVALAVAGIALSGTIFVQLRAAQLPVSAAPQPADGLQRTQIIDTYREVADSGVGRGETLYFYKCWMCHNRYTQDRGPLLKDMYSRPRLASGQPMNDETVAQKINQGGPRMPGFQHSLSQTDMADLLAYLHSGTCCLEGENPPANPRYLAQSTPWPVQKTLSGGAQGVVRIESGDSPEGIGVQLIAPNNVRTTVYTNAEGKFEFPSMKAGTYTLRIATPREFNPHRRAVQISGASKLGDIVLSKIASETGALPATRDVSHYLSSAELLWNLPGTSQEKDSFLRACTSCHSWNQVFRNRFDEHGWALIVDRMANYSLTWLGTRKVRDENGRATNGEVLTPEDVDRVAKWLAKVHGPEAQDPEYHVFPRPRGPSTRVVVTEFELPRQLLNLHDAWGDEKGGVWFTSHRSLYAGKLDMATGVVTGYILPATPGKLPGTHAVRTGKDGIILLSENWARKLDVLDPRTGNVKQFDQPGFSNFGTSKDGYVWFARESTVFKMDTATGQIVSQWPGHCDTQSYDNPISWDGNFWAGGGRPSGNKCAAMLDLRTGKMHIATSGISLSTTKRGGFDPFGNAWFGGGDGALIKLDPKMDRLQEYWPPTTPSPYTYFYEALPDRNGDVWAGVLYGREFVRLEPKTERWRVYWLAEPLAFNRRTWVDNSTTPVTVWYADYNTGYIVRIQPLE